MGLRKQQQHRVGSWGTFYGLSGPSRDTSPAMEAKPTMMKSSLRMRTRKRQLMHGIMGKHSPLPLSAAFYRGRGHRDRGRGALSPWLAMATKPRMRLQHGVRMSHQYKTRKQQGQHYLHRHKLHQWPAVGRGCLYHPGIPWGACSDDAGIPARRRLRTHMHARKSLITSKMPTRVFKTVYTPPRSLRTTRSTLQPV